MTTAQQTGYWHQTGRHQASYEHLTTRYRDHGDSPQGAPMHLLNSTQAAYASLHEASPLDATARLREHLDTLLLDLIHERFHPEDAAQFREDIETLEDVLDAAGDDRTRQDHPALPDGLIAIMERMMDRAILHCTQVENPLRIID